jgi:hypothetical protein
MDLSNRLERLHRERQDGAERTRAELEALRIELARPWWRWLWAVEDDRSADLGRPDGRSWQTGSFMSGLLPRRNHARRGVAIFKFLVVAFA